MDEMEKLAENNVQVQLDLYYDIVNNNNTILYEITKVGRKINDYLTTHEKLEDGGIALSKQEYEEICNLSLSISDRFHLGGVGVLSKEKVPDNETKMMILQKLQAK